MGEGSKASRVDSKMEVDMQRDPQQAVCLKAVAKQLESEKIKEQNEKLDDVPIEVVVAVKKVVEAAKAQSSSLPDPWGTPAAVLRGALQMILSSNAQEDKDVNTVLTWGKYAGKPMKLALEDLAYCKWLLVNQHKITHSEGMSLIARIQKDYQLQGSILVKTGQGQCLADMSQQPSMQEMIKAEVAQALAKFKET